MVHIFKIMALCLTFCVFVSNSRSRHHEYDHHDEYDFSNEDDHEYDHDHDSREMRQVQSKPTATRPQTANAITPAENGNGCTCNVSIFVPQCGSDGLTYADTCRFKCAQRKNPALKLVKVGQCTPSSSG